MSIVKMPEVRRQKTEDRQRSENRDRKTEDRGQKQRIAFSLTCISCTE